MGELDLLREGGGVERDIAYIACVLERGRDAPNETRMQHKRLFAIVCVCRANRKIQGGK